MPLNFDTPILLLIFNRPDITEKIFNIIKSIKPMKLYIAADGPRNNKKGDKDLCQKTRDVTNEITWDCEVKRLYRLDNLGCSEAIKTAIRWFFEHENEGIILEDDCIPNIDYFEFTSNLLNKYRHNPKIMMITGFNPQSESSNLVESYYFSRWATIWGWATWKRAWCLFDEALSEWPEYSKLFEDDKYFESCPVFKEYLMYSFDKNYMQRDKTAWSYLWVYTMLKNDGLCIVPSVNLISNIGHEGAHQTGGGYTPYLDLPTSRINSENLIDPKEIAPNHSQDMIRFNKYIKTHWRTYSALQIGRYVRRLGIFPKYIKYHPFYIGIVILNILKKR